MGDCLSIKTVWQLRIIVVTFLLFRVFGFLIQEGAFLYEANAVLHKKWTNVQRVPV